MRATLASNSGTSAVSIDFGSLSDFDGASGYEATVEMTAAYWSRNKVLLPCKFSAEGLWLATGELMKLHSALLEWLATPFADLRTTEFVGEFELTRRPGENLRLSFEPQKNRLLNCHPALSVAIRNSNFSGQHNFGADQSCLRLFAEELAVCLSFLH
jgi:hypothetical protein